MSQYQLSLLKEILFAPNGINIYFLPEIVSIHSVFFFNKNV